MIQLVQNISGELFDNNTGSVKLLGGVSGQYQEEDYIDLPMFKAFLQNLSKTEKTSALTKPLLFGLKNSKNISMIDVNINY